LFGSAAAVTVGPSYREIWGNTGILHDDLERFSLQSLRSDLQETLRLTGASAGIHDLVSIADVCDDSVKPN
jgi:hypothetical protein